jgi:hypothetical protein
MRRTSLRGVSKEEAKNITPFPNVRRLKLLFPSKTDEWGYDRKAYLLAVAKTLGLPQVLGETGVVVPRERVNEIVAELFWYSGYHDQVDVMCKEYGDDEDWCGITTDDTESWDDNHGGLPDDDYLTFELW